MGEAGASVLVRDCTSLPVERRDDWMRLAPGIHVPDDEGERLVLTVFFVHVNDVAHVEGNRERRLAAEALRLRLRPTELRRETLEDTLSLAGEDFVAVLEPAGNVAAALDDRECSFTYVWEQVPRLEVGSRERHPEELLRVLVLAQIVIEALEETGRRLLGAEAVQDRDPPLVADVERRVVGKIAVPQAPTPPMLKRDSRSAPRRRATFPSSSTPSNNPTLT
jgi:hypothetical protein